MQVTINIPAEKDRPPPRFDSSEFGDSWWSVLTKVQAMFTELFGVGAALPNAQYTTAALQSAPMTGAQVAGAKVVVFDNTGTTPGNLQMPIATEHHKRRRQDRDKDQPQSWARFLRLTHLACARVLCCVNSGESALPFPWHGNAPPSMEPSH
jgi:hypothetical protein